MLNLLVPRFVEYYTTYNRCKGAGDLHRDSIIYVGMLQILYFFNVLER